MEKDKSWNSFWSKYAFTDKQDRQIIRQELHSVRWRKIEKEILNRFGSFKGLKVVEIGSGRGEISALMALNGANVTLIDNSRTALEKAQDLFTNLGHTPKLIMADIMHLPGELLNSFDVSMSFGLAEHFDYPRRESVIKLHAGLLNPRGVSFIAVPNRSCLPYRFFMKLSDILGYPDEAIEIPFTRLELQKVAIAVGFKSHKIVGSSLIRDTVYFLCTRYISHLSKWKLIIDTTVFEIPLVFDDYFGYSLVLIGTKS